MTYTLLTEFLLILFCSQTSTTYQRVRCLVPPGYYPNTLLRERALCPVVLRLIMNMYVNQCIQIKWNSMISEKYGIANGVKQGGVLSPILFGIYMDNLIKRLKDSNIGCKIGNNYVGVFCYADDLTLISPTLTGLKCMLSICENYADEYKILFNASKSQLLHFTKCNTQEKSL